ncbi:hypothetical protein Y032_0088g2149 [Ancylostoma ceylanicum]|uniref:Uncharacterized protein n=1 Tax=Ancylostoma ceylanicum TaxID=53326 RepID=A0A016TPD3_9BILA|nr:hypothetical protein Y032_0088g2149 [Ancylostoma ceylanicum]
MKWSLVKNHCLCGAMHIRSGARLVSIVFLVLAAVHLINTLGFISGYPGSPIVSTFAFAIICTLVYGVYAERRYFLLPFLIAKGLLTLATVSGFLVWVALHAAYGEHLPDYTNGSFLGYIETIESRNERPNTLVCIGLAFITIICIQLYIIKMFLNFYCFLREGHQALLTDTAVSHQYSPISTTTSSGFYHS